VTGRDPRPRWRLSIANRAKRDLRTLDPPVRDRVLDALERLRDTAERIIYVRRVLPRGRAYER
jgi:mRNA-degrading endonuclease RelE of RelBE toxin-antitoxin system